MTKEDLKLIKDAFRLVLTEETKAIDETISSSPIPSENLYQRCDEKAREIIEERKALPFKKAITILIAATLIISIFSITAYALRDKIGGFFIDFFDKYAVFSSENTSNSQIPNPKVSTTYIPDGFSVTRYIESASSTLLEWKNNENSIIFHIRTLTDGKFVFDTENSEYVIVKIGNLSVHRSEKYGQINATWTDGKMVYALSATGVEWDEMVKIIEGIKVEE